jgi:hypothetical protein
VTKTRSTFYVSRFTQYVSRFTLIPLFTLPALQPLLSDQFTCGYDNSFHLWRAVQLDHLLRQGVLYPRWAADMAHGFGYPLFEFAAPLSAYLSVGLKALGLGWAQALNGAFALGILASAVCTYLLVRDWWGRAAGLVAAVAYTLAPYHAYDVFNRGGLSEASAWFLPPLILWALGRDNPRGLIITTLGTATLVLTHNGFALIFMPLLLAYALLQGRLRGRRALLTGLAGLGLGVGLSAFFWLPALGELAYVHSDRLTDVWVFQYAHNFLPLDHLLALPRVTDPSLLNDWPPRGLGLVPAFMALLPLVGWRRLDRASRWRVALFLASLALFSLMTLPISRPLWDHLPLLPYVQFPWRFLGPAAFCASVLAGAVVAAMARSPALSDKKAHRATLAGAVLIAVLFVANQGWFFPDHCSPPDNPTIAGMIGWELATDTLGTTAGGEYLPRWVKRVPGKDQGTPSLTAAYMAGEPVARLSAQDLPDGAQLLRADYGPLNAAIELHTPVPFRASYLAFYYPGWQVHVDDQSVPVTPSAPYGLITFDVPAGEHTIRVHFGSTPLRTAATLLSLASLVALLATTYVLHQRTSGQMRKSANLQICPFAYLPICLFALLLIVARFFIAQGHTPLRRVGLVGGQLRGVDQSYAIDFGGRWLLLGHDRLPEQVDDVLQVRLYWRALDAQGRDYAASLALVDAEGQRWTQIGMRSPRWHREPPPVYAWPADRYAQTAYLADLLPGTPPGDYRLIMTAFDKSDPQTPLTAHAPDGAALGPSLELGTVRVERLPHAPSPDDVPMQTRLGANLGPLNLAGVNLDRAEAAPGDPMLVTFFWTLDTPALHPQRGASVGYSSSSDGKELPDLGARLALVDEKGTEAMLWELPPVRDDWPTTLWERGDLWRGQHLLRLPASLESGDYTWRLGLERGVSGETVNLGQLRINAPERLWQAPPLQLPLDVELGQQATLLGANLEPASVQSSDSLTVTLVWQGRAEMSASLRVFLHLLKPDGSLLTQSDGEPANWTRPTTGWAPGEVILDQRVLQIPADAPPGPYTLLTGLYDPTTGNRLPLPNGATAIPIITLTLEEP